GSIVLGTGTLSNRSATLTIVSLPVGSHSFTAAYSGDGNFAGSASSALAQTINQAGSAMSVTGQDAGDGVNFIYTATIGAVAPGMGTPTGTVSVVAGGTVIGTGTLFNGVTQITVADAAATGQVLSFVYNGDSNFLTTSSMVA